MLPARITADNDSKNIPDKLNMLFLNVFRLRMNSVRTKITGSAATDGLENNPSPKSKVATKIFLSEFSAR